MSVNNQSMSKNNQYLIGGLVLLVVVWFFFMREPFYAYRNYKPPANAKCQNITSGTACPIEKSYRYEYTDTYTKYKKCCNI